MLKQLLRIDAKDEVHREMFRYWLKNRETKPAQFLMSLARMYRSGAGAEAAAAAAGASC